MSRATLKAIQAAAGNAGDAATYVDDVFSTYVYQGTGRNTFIENDIALSNTTDGGSAYFPSGSQQGSADQYPIQLDSNITLSGDFTIEMWIKRDGTATTGECILSPDFGSGGGNIQIGVRNSSDGTAPDALYIYDGGTYNGSTTNTVPPKAWTHIAYSRSGSTVYYWVNGVAAGTAATSYSFVINTIGALGGYGAGPVGYISNLRISNNARYTSAFTVPTSALSSDANTLLLILQGASPFTDQSGNKTLTVASTTEASTEGPFDSGDGGYGGLVWIKGRGPNAFNHILEDTVRGADRFLRTNTTNAELIGGSGVTAFNSNGFTTGTNGAVTFSGDDFVSWTFRKQPGFFDVVTYTGNGTNQAISHNLDSTPGMIIVKRTDSSTNGFWIVYHRGTSASPQNDYMTLQTTQGVNQWVDWNETAPTSTQFEVGSVYTNTSGATYVAYLFAHDAQDFGTDSDEAIIKCGSYTGNGSTTGPIIDLGFEPQWILLKGVTSGASYDWRIHDTMRGWTADGTGAKLEPNTSDVEDTAECRLKCLPNGFQPSDNAAVVNASGATYIYVAIRRPHKPASELEATGVFSVKNYAATTSSASVTHDVVFDAEISANRDISTAKFHFVDQLRGINGVTLRSSSTSQELSYPTFWSRQNMYTMYAPSQFDSWWASSSGTQNHISYALKRAPGFFDVVTYTGTGSNMTIPHNLGVAPELFFLKKRNLTRSWGVYSKSIDIDQYLTLNTTGAAGSFALWQSTAPTATQFTVGTDGSVNGSGDTFVVYLFATVPGISKVDSYTGTGSDVNVNCGFTSGARFVLVKRTDSTGDWYVWDSVRGIVAGNDPYLLLNSDAAQITTTDYIDPLSSGFTITSSAPAALNASGGSYIFLAIA